MAIKSDFALVIPKTAVYIPHAEFTVPFREFLTSAGITDPSLYDTYEVAIIIQTKYHVDQPSLFEAFLNFSRKRKRASFAAADGMFIIFETGHDDIIFREIAPPTTYIDGQTEFTFAGSALAGGEVKVGGMKAAADLQAKFRREFRSKNLSIIAQRNNRFAMWEFRRSWIETHHQPLLHLICSVKKTVPENARFVKCQSRVSQSGRTIYARRRPQTIALPIPAGGGQPVST